MENQIEEEKVKKITKQILKEMGMKTHFLGFKYWITAVTLILKNEKFKDNNFKMMDLYKEVARKHKTTTLKVERALRYSHEELEPEKYFKVNYHINNTAFLYLLVETVENKIFINNCIYPDIKEPKILDC